MPSLPQFSRTRWLRCCGALVALACLSACRTTAQASEDSLSTPRMTVPLQVMTCNVRLPTDADGGNRWDVRKGLAARMLRDAAPDVFGTQELFKEQGDYLLAQLPGYAWFGRGRRGGAGDEHMGVFYRKATLQLLDSGDFWLSDTPGLPGSITWGNLFPRMVTWGLFERVVDGRRFYLFNTHLPYREQDDEARLRGAHLLVSRIAKLPADIPVVVTGDFNTTPDTPVHAALTDVLRDTRQTAQQRSGPEATFHNFTGKPDRRIDWILVRGLDVRSVHTIDMNEDGRYPSDHFPVMAELGWPSP